VCRLKIEYVERNRAEYGERYNQIRFADGYQTKILNDKRAFLLEQLSDRVEWGLKGTKADCSGLSQGCRLCTEGSWSCLFINGICNCSCFYCPSSQDEDCLPTTNSVSFESSMDYVAYLKKFNFKGASISGGEPLLTFDRTLNFISEIKKELGDDIYLWMYTNGKLADEEKMLKLKNAGLDEIRFDIGALEYNLEKLKTAVGVIPVVTVEIPAIPDEVEVLKKLIPELAEMGVNHLNLHQLRLTPYNFDKLTERGYFFINEEKVISAESEIAALEIMLYSLDFGYDLPVNYCSFPYKNRFQGLASRKRNALLMAKACEDITENGFIRQITVFADKERMSGLVEELKQFDSTMYEKSRISDSAVIHPTLIKHLDTKDLQAKISYFFAAQSQNMSYKYPFKKVELTDNKNIFVEKYKAVQDFLLEGDECEKTLLYFAGDKDMLIKEEMLKFEKIKEGLSEY